MLEESAAELYRRDRQAYLDAFWSLEQERTDNWDEDELALVNGLAYWLGQDEIDGLPEIVAMGFLAGTLEHWRDEIVEHRFTTIWRSMVEAEIGERFSDDWDRDWWSRTVSCIVGFNDDLERYAFDAEHLDERLQFLCDAVGEKVFQGGLSPENREGWHGFHRFGCALALYVVWLQQMEALGVPEGERWTDELYARPESDPLTELDLPLAINGCELKREDIVGGYEIRSTGPLGGGHWMRFRAFGDMAEIVVIMKEGKLGVRQMDVPVERHVDVFRQLGFTEMRYPNGKRYELRNWPGVKRIRD